MLDFQLWVDLAAAYVRVEARRVGGVVVSVKRARTTRSVYIEVRGGVAGRAVVRLSDHGCPGRGGRRSMLSIRQRACGRLCELAEFLRGRFLLSSATVRATVGSGEGPSEREDNC